MGGPCPQVDVERTARSGCAGEVARLREVLCERERVEEVALLEAEALAAAVAVGTGDGAKAEAVTTTALAAAGGGDG